MTAAGHVQDDAAGTVDKALSLLHMFHGGEAVGVSELARRASLSKSTAYRLLATLQRNGFVDRKGSAYRLGRSLYELGGLVYERYPGRLRETLLPFMTDLYERTHEIVHLAVLQDTQVVYLEKLHGHQRVACPSRIGGRVPAYCTAVGKVLLSHDFEAIDRTLAEGLKPLTPTTITDRYRFIDDLGVIRSSGLAYDDEEAVRALTCVAVPVVDHLGRPVAALSIAGAKGRFNPRAHAHHLRATAAAASAALRRQQAAQLAGMTTPMR